MMAVALGDGAVENDRLIVMAYFVIDAVRKILSGYGAVKILYDQRAFQECGLLRIIAPQGSGLRPNPSRRIMIHLLRSRATQGQLTEMLEELTEYVKLAVDVKREVVVGGGELHADCETVLLEDGSKQEDVWGADWWPLTKEVRYGSFINIRPGQNNPAMEILAPAIRDRVDVIVRSFFEGV
jgi:hypothetical protein